MDDSKVNNFDEIIRLTRKESDDIMKMLSKKKQSQEDVKESTTSSSQTEEKAEEQNDVNTSEQAFLIPEKELSSNPEDMKEQLGEFIYNYIEETFPGEHTGNLTGMILDGFKENLLALNHRSIEELNKIVQKAISVFAERTASQK